MQILRNCTGRYWPLQTPATFKTSALNRSATLPTVDSAGFSRLQDRTNRGPEPSCYRFCYPTSSARLFMAARITPSTVAAAPPPIFGMRCE
jgi:hypothetical protein